MLWVLPGVEMVDCAVIVGWLGGAVMAILCVGLRACRFCVLFLVFM